MGSKNNLVDNTSNNRDHCSMHACHGCLNANVMDLEAGALSDYKTLVAPPVSNQNGLK